MWTWKQVRTENTVWPTGCQTQEEFFVSQMLSGDKKSINLKKMAIKLNELK